jgi:CheY-like chemotaxis protein
MTPYRVVVLDDDADDRDLLLEALEVQGVEPVLGMDSAAEVLNYLQEIESSENLPELIVTDMNMYGLKGLELLQNIRQLERYCDITLVVYSTSAHPADVRQCLVAGAKDYLTKPCSYAELKAVAAKLKKYLSTPSVSTFAAI